MFYSDVIIRLAAIIPLIHIATTNYFRTKYLLALNATLVVQHGLSNTRFLVQICLILGRLRKNNHRWYILYVNGKSEGSFVVVRKEYYK